MSQASNQTSTAGVPLTGGIPEAGVTLRIVREARAVKWNALPEATREAARQCLLDWLGCTIAGADDELVNILAEEFGHEETGTSMNGASLIARGVRMAPLQAALVNGAASHALDYDDVNLAMLGHPSVAILPGLLALAESRDADGAATMSAFVAGYEAACRVGKLVGSAHYDHGFHTTATVGSIGAAVACAHLLGLDETPFMHAVGIAATQAAGLKSMFGTMCKPLHAGKAAQNGLLAARLASRGFTSRTDALECAQGFAATLSTTLNVDAALAAPPRGHYIVDTLFKYHAACYLTHAAIECAVGARRAEQFAPDRITSIVLRTNLQNDKVCNIAEPRTGLEAKFSLRQTVAMALTGLDTASPAAYSDGMAGDGVLAALRDKVRVELVDGLTITAADLTLTTVDGTVLQQSHDAGVPVGNLAEQRLRLQSKFNSLVTPVFGKQATERLTELAAQVDQSKNIATLLRAATLAG
jgi:2-methylcitrate dehydratase PrpD